MADAEAKDKVNRAIMAVWVWDKILRGFCLSF
jgi:hypothetical protein